MRDQSKKYTPKSFPISAEEAAEVSTRAFEQYKGDITEYQRAVGVLFTGIGTGWRALYLVHHTHTLKKYEKILGIEFRECLVEVGPYANKSLAWQAFQKFSNFWKAVKGEIKDVKTPQFE